MTYQPTTADYERVIEAFWYECDTATPERLKEIGEVIRILREEQAKRGLL